MMVTFEDTLGRFSDDLAVLAMAIEYAKYFAFIADLVFQNDILVFHVIVVPQAHPAKTEGTNGINLNRFTLFFVFDFWLDGVSFCAGVLGHDFTIINIGCWMDAFVEQFEGLQLNEASICFNLFICGVWNGGIGLNR